MTTRILTYRSEDGVTGYIEGDVLVDVTCGEATRAVRTGHGMELEMIRSDDLYRLLERAGRAGRPLTAGLIIEVP